MDKESVAIIISTSQNTPYFSTPLTDTRSSNTVSFYTSVIYPWKVKEFFPFCFKKVDKVSDFLLKLQKTKIGLYYQKSV